MKKVSKSNLQTRKTNQRSDRIEQCKLLNVHKIMDHFIRRRSSSCMHGVLGKEKAFPFLHLWTSLVNNA